MQIRNVGSHANVDRLNESTAGKSAERGRRAERSADDGGLTAGADDARISSAGRETAAAVEQLAERARRDDGDRDALVAEARQKLVEGRLDTAEVFAATAKRLGDGGFLSA